MAVVVVVDGNKNVAVEVVVKDDIVMNDNQTFNMLRWFWSSGA